MEKFYKSGLHFECQRCSFCCGHSPGFVYLSKRDLTTLCKHFDMTVKDFVEKYCRWADYYYGSKVLALLEKKNYDCILWENGCSCYEAKFGTKSTVSLLISLNNSSDIFDNLDSV